MTEPRSLKRVKKPIVIPKGCSTDIVRFAGWANKLYNGVHYSLMLRKEEGPRLVEIAKGKASLRELRRRSGISTAYLSLVQRGEIVISPGAFVLLVQVAAARESREVLIAEAKRRKESRR